MSLNHSKGGSANRNSSGRSLLSREEQYKNYSRVECRKTKGEERQLNDELTAKTASLVQEAEAVLKGQENILSKPSLLDRIASDDYFGVDLESDYATERDQRAQESIRTKHDGQYQPQTQSSARQTSIGKVAQTSQGNSRRAVPKSVRSKTKASAVTDDVATFDDFSFQKTVSTIEQRFNAAASADINSTNYPHVDDDEDIMPSAANEMGAEAQIRFLKAKLRVMQEEMDRLSTELSSKEEKLHEANIKIKEIDEDKNRFQKTNAIQLTQLEKYKKLAEDSKSRADSLDSQLTGLKKELDSVKRNQKQQSTNQSATEVRLNQAREDAQKFKNLYQKSQIDAKEIQDQEKNKLDHLVAENKRLEKQKSELMNGFKKQLKLIDVLKRQKMHLEAARMLNFTEEEFVKALEWGN